MDRRRAFAFALLTTSPLAALHAQDRRMTVEDSLTFASAGGATWAPGGEHIIFTIRKVDPEDFSSQTHIYRMSREGGEPTQLTRGEGSEGSPRVSPDGHYLSFTASREEGSEIWLLPLGGGEAWRLTDQDNGVSGYRWSPDSASIVFATRDDYPDKEEREEREEKRDDEVVVDRDFLWTHLWVIDVESKETRRLTEGEFNAGGAAFSPDGAQIAFRATYNPSQPSGWHHIDDNGNSDIFLIDAEGGTTSNLTPGPGSASNPAWSPDGQSLAYGAATGYREKSNLFILDLRSRIARNLTADDPNPVGGATWARDGESLVYTQGVGLYTHVFAIPAVGGEAVQETDGFGVRGGLELSPDGEFTIFTVNDPTRPGDLWLFESATGETRQLTDVNPHVAEFALAPAEPIQWESTDGVPIEGLLTYPLDYTEGDRVPLILQIHGGPYGKFSHNFSARNQVLAANGYAILQPNPRGSTGYGHDFMISNRGDWGGMDFNADDMTGVDLVIEMGVADADKLVVMGGSYGGFSTFWAVTQTDRFKAAIAHAAISDWTSFHGQSDIPALMEYGFLGYPWETPEIYRQWSPITHADNVTTPLLITHGERDQRVPIAQAEQYFTALKKRGAVVEFVRYPREGHGIREPRHVIDLVGRQIEWFDRHLGIERENRGEKDK